MNWTVCESCHSKLFADRGNGEWVCWYCGREPDDTILDECSYTDKVISSFVTDDDCAWTIVDRTVNDDTAIDIALGDITNFYHRCGTSMFGLPPIYCQKCTDAASEHGCGRHFVLYQVKGLPDVEGEND